MKKILFSILIFSQVAYSHDGGLLVSMSVGGIVSFCIALTLLFILIRKSKSVSIYLNTYPILLSLSFLLNMYIFQKTLFLDIKVFNCDPFALPLVILVLGDVVISIFILKLFQLKSNVLIRILLIVIIVVVLVLIHFLGTILAGIIMGY